MSKETNTDGKIFNITEEEKKPEDIIPNVPRIGYAYLVAFNMKVRIRKLMKPLQDLLIPDSAELIFDQPLLNSAPANEVLTKMKQEEFFRSNLAHPESGERELIFIKTTNVHYWGKVELIDKEKEPIN